eukprot:TRINITY_DN6680_c0_g2_i1.p1 TRINITY_DN6680_c0_g2~~TRINITY_DN6680_c0_g2_i1.p1  ORF type:complete len:350 (+),score=81.49 TRINITY_DN6680_c0_g2_i1:70-1119(+)
MGGCNSTEQDKVSSDINKELSKTRTKMKREVKILLLGTGASGKTTIAKQMRIIHLNGYSDKDRLMFKEFILHNIFNSMKSLVRAADKFLLEIEEGLKDIAEEMRSMTLQLENIGLDEEKGKKIQALWQSDSIQKAFEMGQEFLLDDAAEYFFDKLEDICDENYVPSIIDILRVRIKSTGLKEIQFACKGFTFRVVDVGGQRSERKKWIHCFQDVTAILFVVALNDYERVLEEDHTTNRMIEAIELFQQIINNRFFEETNIILFLNKKDIFLKRLEVSPIKKCFPEYNGKAEYKDSIEFIRLKFFNTNRNKERSIYYHETDATDTSNIKVVWNAVHEISVRGALKESNLI